MATMLVVLLVANLVALYACVIRPWYLQWGASQIDLDREMPADTLVRRPLYSTTMAVTVNAAPEQIWPWLVQMGYRRGGLYSYDWLDRLFGYLDRPSATEILPEHQELRDGDEIPIGRGGGFPVHTVIPGRVLVLGGDRDGFRWYWQIGLYPTGHGNTRLVSRNSAVTPRTFATWLFMRVLEAAAFVMTRRMLLGLKWRAERLAASGGGAHPQAA